MERENIRRTEAAERNAKKRRRKKKSKAPILFLLLMIMIAVAGGAVWVLRYAPTNEHGSLESYFTTSRADEACVVLNGEYKEYTSEEAVYGLYEEGNYYLEYNFVKDNLDDGYVYDFTEGVLRYATDTQIVTATVNRSDYTIDGAAADAGARILWVENNTVYILADFITNFTDMTFTTQASPNRIFMETGGYTKTVATLRRNAAVRRFGGPKSLILEDGVQGEQVTILEDYGKWVCVLTEKGTIGCVMDRQLRDKNEVTVASTIPTRTYMHKTLSGGVNLGWHQVTNQTANGKISDILAETSGLNVICPTWFQLADNNGNINNLASAEYIALAHSQGLQVWALVSNIEVKVDEESVLNVTSHRDLLVSNLINACVASGIDGINVDFEALSGSCRDGYAQFIRELSIACEKQDLYLSVDNYPPAAHNMFYNRALQADYADYVILMAYDEHNATTEPGSTASLPFVEESITATLEEVPAEQLVLALPFYTRVWTGSGETYSCSAIGMKKIPEFLAENGATTTWLTEEAQNYAEFPQGDNMVKIWVEDAASLTEKLKMKGKYNLAGLAYWKLGLQSPDIWSTIAQYK